jgi:hypothetical protein
LSGSGAAVNLAPSDFPDFLLLFHGLLCFARNNNYGPDKEHVCEVGVHTKTSDHEFNLLVFELQQTDGGDEWEFRPLYHFAPERPRDVPDREIIVDVSDPTVPGVSFFQGSGDDTRDWRRVPDLEGPDFYNRPLNKRPRAMRLRLIVKHGLFYSLTTEHQFDRIIEEDQQYRHPLGEIAYFAAAEVAHNEGGHLSIEFGRGGEGAPQRLMLRATDKRKYWVFFFNSCPDDPTTSANERRRDCPRDPTNPIKERRNDFHLYLKTFRLPAQAREFGVILRQEENGEATSAGRRAAGVEEAPAAAVPFTRNVASTSFIDGLFSIELLAKLLSSFESPCGAAFFGQTTNGPGGNS